MSGRALLACLAVAAACSSAGRSAPPVDAAALPADTAAPGPEAAAPDARIVADASAPDAAPPPADARGGTGADADVVEAPPAASPAAALAGLVLEQPCPAGMGASGSCSIPSGRARMKSVTFGGDPARTYSVALHVCGVTEGRRYTGCSATQGGGLLCTDGKTQNQVADDPTYPTYELRIAAPAHSHLLNSKALYDDLMKIDYSFTIDVQGGSAITLLTDGGSNADTYTSRLKGHDFTCAGVPGLMQPYLGQFVYLTVESVTPAP